MYCLKFPFLRTVKFNNFVPYELSLYNCGHELASVTLKKKRFALKMKSVTLKGPVVEKTKESTAAAMVLKIFL